MEDHRVLVRHSLIGCLAMLLGLAPTIARAQQLQPLEEFLGHARMHNVDAREARATALQRAHEASEAFARLLPTATVQADAIGNEYLGAVDIPVGVPGSPGATTRHVVITPTDQRDATLTLALPLLDLSGWRNLSAARATHDAQEDRVAATDLTVQATIASTYYQLVGAAAVGRAARRTLAAAEDNVAFLATRVRAGLAADLDLKRGIAEVDRDRQAIEDADYTIVTLRRSLATTSGLDPSGDPLEGVPSLPADDLHDEAPLDQWMGVVDGLPSVRAAQRDDDAALRTAAATRATAVPTVSLQLTERATNAIGFGYSPSWSLSLVGAWTLDLSTRASARALAAAAEAAAVRTDRARDAAADALFDAWQQVRTQIAKARAARSSLDASRAALGVAREEFTSGRATSLDVIQAERDAFTAEVTEIQAEADLASARVALRLAAGRAPEAP